MKNLNCPIYEKSLLVASIPLFLICIFLFLLTLIPRELVCLEEKIIEEVRITKVAGLYDLKFKDGTSASVRTSNAPFDNQKFCIKKEEHIIFIP